MREQRVVRLCDSCLNVGRWPVEREATASIVFQTNGRPRRYDHCARHGDPTWSRLLELSTVERGG